MARLLDVSQQTYAKYESGVIRATPDMQARIAVLLGAAQRDVFPEDEAVA